MKHWIVATYKINELKRVEYNLSNQDLNYYLPKITIKQFNSKSKQELLFPGYVFIETGLKDQSSIKYTKGIKNIIKFGEKIPYITKEEIKNIITLEKSSKLKPLLSKIKIGQEVLIKNGYFKGNIGNIFSLPSKKRVEILLFFLGSMRRFTIFKKDIQFIK